MVSWFGGFFLFVCFYDRVSHLELTRPACSKLFQLSSTGCARTHHCTGFFLLMFWRLNSGPHACACNKCFTSLALSPALLLALFPTTNVVRRIHCQEQDTPCPTLLAGYSNCSVHRRYYPKVSAMSSVYTVGLEDQSLHLSE